nr:SMP-30/gluconolactonase/LRE family protein [uncultured Macellibacteroides sp.]
MKQFAYALLSSFILFGTVAAQTESTDLVPEGTFTSGIEGPAVDAKGNLYAVNYGDKGTIGVITPCGTHSLFVTLPEGSTGNGIRFNAIGDMFVADYTGHNILRVDMGTKAVSVFAHEPLMNQPNDITIAPNGTIYASDPAWAKNTGKLWMITPSGNVKLLLDEMGTTNGVEVSPDGRLLYVNESVQRNVWVFDIEADGSLSNKRLFYSFPDFGMDGMRCDEKGNLYICRYDKGTVLVVSPEGKSLHEYWCKGKKPSNITFGGQKNKQIYITLQDRGCIEVFEALNPGAVLFPKP